MALTQKLELRQTQSLVMTPQLMQAIKLLQLSNLDLIAYVEAEIERNPLLERADGEEEGEGGQAEPAAEQGAEGDETPDWLERRLDADADASAGKLDTDLADRFPDDHGTPAGESPPAPDPWSSIPTRQTISTEHHSLEAYVAAEKSLADHLGDQLRLAIEHPSMRLIGQVLVNEIDESGYLRIDIAAVAERLAAPIELVEKTLAVIHTLEPAGVGARDLAECLAIQLRERDRLDPAMAALIDHLDLVARHDYAALKKLCGVDEEDLADMLVEIRSLNPKPGADFGALPVQTVVPDVLVREGPDGGWLVELNSGTLPKVLVNQSYYAAVVGGRRSKEDRTYLADCLQTANWLVKSLDQRARTILKVATEIVRQQDGFLARGVQYLRPLNLKTVADAISMHESTVSRVTSNKYMATSRGIFELKYFFTPAIAAADGGEAHSAEAVRFRIRRLIEQELPEAVLSDDVIVRVLRESGVDIARRTVAKYREAMRIPSSVQRRREKTASG
ncbi:MAG: RNA polymerase factor sigma-54 [Bauldia sp.]